MDWEPVIFYEAEQEYTEDVLDLIKKMESMDILGVKPMDCSEPMDWEYIPEPMDCS